MAATCERFGCFNELPARNKRWCPGRCRRLVGYETEDERHRKAMAALDRPVEELQLSKAQRDYLELWEYRLRHTPEGIDIAMSILEGIGLTLDRMKRNDPR